MPKYREKDQDIIDLLMRRIKELERRVKHLENSMNPTAPIYDMADLPADLQNGQFFISTANQWRFKRGGTIYNAGP